MRNSLLAACIVLVLVSATTVRAATIWNVDAGGSGDFTTIQAAISSASSGDTINIAAGTYTATGVNLNKSLTFIGEGAGSTIIQAAATPQSGGGRIFNLNANTTTTLQGLTIRNADASGSGGAIYLAKWVGTANVHLNIDSVVFADNRASASGGAIYFGDSHLDMTQSNNSVVISDSLFFSNSASNGSGGAMYIVANDITITNSTFSQNDTYNSTTDPWARRGAVHISAPDTKVLRNSTFVGNTNRAGSRGGDALATNDFTVESCVFDNNTGGDYAIYDSTLVNTVYEGNAYSTTGGTKVTDAMVDPTLADNGGATMTHVLLLGSPAIDVGSNPGSLPYDQRGAGFVRTYGAGTDAGAFEVQPAPVPEPATLTLLGLGGLAMIGGAIRRRRKR